MDKPILSVVVISHNQKEVLQRCIESILAQKTSFPVEVIVSDDRSNDGTREMLLDKYKDNVISVFFNSDEYETSYTLERAALNRINGLKKATGKYLIHVDGDDFFTSTDLFQAMVDKLEEHPECSMSVQNYYQRPYDDLFSETQPAKPLKLFIGERILSGVDFATADGIGHNSCCCMRRTDNVKIEELTSSTYDDIDITLRYLGVGKVALVNRTDFVYVSYSGSSSTTMTDKEKYIMYNTFIIGIPLAPALAGALLRKYMKSIARISLEGMRNNSYPERMIRYCRKLNLRILEGFNEKMKLKDRVIYGILFLLSGSIAVMPYKTKGMIRLIYKLAINKKITADIVI